MIKLISLCLLLAVCKIAHIEGHGRMSDPPARDSVWRLPEGRDFPVAKFDTEWCGYNDPADIRNTRNVTCGVCGPIYNGDPRGYTMIFKRNDEIDANMTSFEWSSSVYTGKILKTYKKGELITIKLRVCFILNHSQYLYKLSIIFIFKIQANHGGSVEFRICEVTNENEDPKRECFDSNRLAFKNGNFVFPLNNGTIIDGPVYDYSYCV